MGAYFCRMIMGKGIVVFQKVGRMFLSTFCIGGEMVGETGIYSASDGCVREAVRAAGGMKAENH